VGNNPGGKKDNRERWEGVWGYKQLLLSMRENRKKGRARQGKTGGKKKGRCHVVGGEGCEAGDKFGGGEHRIRAQPAHLGCKDSLNGGKKRGGGERKDGDMFQTYKKSRAFRIKRGAGWSTKNLTPRLYGGEKKRGVSK